MLVGIWKVPEGPATVQCLSRWRPPSIASALNQMVTLPRLRTAASPCRAGVGSDKTLECPKTYGRAVCKCFLFDELVSRFNVSGLGASPRPRWRSAHSDPHKLLGDKAAILGGRFSECRRTVRQSLFSRPANLTNRSDCYCLLPSRLILLMPSPGLLP